MKIIINQKIVPAYLVCLVFGFLLKFSSCSRTKKPDRLNIIIILADDLGYNDLVCYNALDPSIRTPNIDRLAAEGMRFKDWQSANCVCGPSRAAILTGRYPPCNGYVVVSHPFDKDQYEYLGLYQDEVTIPELLKPLGYRTAAIGKWHIGAHYDYLPLRYGFDHYYGRLENFGYGKEGDIYMDDSLTTESLHYDEIHQMITENTLVFIRKSNGEGDPFFLYMSHYLVHGPWKPNKQFTTEGEWQEKVKYEGNIRKNVYPAMVRELDWHIGLILDELDKLGISDHTVIFITSDNGPCLTSKPEASAGSAWPLRGSKFNTFEGGHRVPGIVKYPGHVPPGKLSVELVSSMDIFPTIAGITGAEMPEGRILDGRSIWPILTDQKGAKLPHNILFAYTGKNLQAIRKGKYKIHLPRTPGSVPFYSQHKWGKGTIDSLVTLMLFNLEEDIEEQNNLADIYPDIMNELLEEAKKARNELGDWNMTVTDEHHYNGFEGNIHAIPIPTMKK